MILMGLPTACWCASKQESMKTTEDFFVCLSQSKGRIVLWKQSKQNRKHMGMPSKGGNMTVPEETCKHIAQHQNQIRETHLESVTPFILGRYHHLCKMPNCMGDWQMEMQRHPPQWGLSQPCHPEGSCQLKRRSWSSVSVRAEFWSLPVCVFARGILWDRGLWEISNYKIFVIH